MGIEDSSQRNRAEFQALLAQYGITQAEAAARICHQTARPCSVRAVRSWVNDPEKPSSRPCPAWAVSALRRACESMSGGE